MAVYLGISRTLSFLDRRPGHSNYWCVSGLSATAGLGDQVLLYFPVAVSVTKNGVAQIYDVSSPAEVRYDSPCASRGMAHVDTKLQMTLPNRITAKQMKAEPALKDWGALRRSFQGVTFAIPAEIWPHLRALIVKRNPEADGVLQR